MNFRGKVVPITIDLNMNNEPLVCNLHAFTFTNDDKTVLGYLRWIPKLIVSNERNKIMIVYIDCFWCSLPV